MFLIQVGNFLYVGIAPQLFQIIVGAHVRQEYMHKYVAVVDYYPLRISVAVVVVGFHA